MRFLSGRSVVLLLSLLRPVEVAAYAARAALGEPPSAPASGLYSLDPVELATRANILVAEPETLGPVTFTLNGEPFGWPHPHGSQYDQFGAITGNGKQSRGLATHVAQGFVLKFVGRPHELIDFRFFHADTQTMYYVDLQHVMTHLNKVSVSLADLRGPMTLAVSKTPFFPCSGCKDEESTRRLSTLNEEEEGEWEAAAKEDLGHTTRAVSARRLSTKAEAEDDHDDDEHHVHPPPPPPPPPADATAAVVLWVLLIVALLLLLCCPLCARTGGGTGWAGTPAFVVVVPSKAEAKTEPPKGLSDPKRAEASAGASVTDGRFVVSRF
mgnify:FL=1|tara:strand:+ start:91 stop:1065 length:975 start_codon:yes stop_codon:yes gene_type:complete